MRSVQETETPNERSEEVNEQTQKRTLLNITDDMQALDDLLHEAGGDVTDESVQQYVKQLTKELEDDLHNKVDGYISYIRHLELQAAARQEEAERLKKAADANHNSAKHLKERLKGILEKLGVKKAGNVRQATVAGNGGKQPVWISDDVKEHPEKLPERFQRVKVFPDTDAIREALENGESLEDGDGWTFAQLEERGTHLRVK